MASHPPKQLSTKCFIVGWWRQCTPINKCNYPAMKLKERHSQTGQVGNVQGIQASEGNNLGRLLNSQRSDDCIGKRSWIRKWWGGSPELFHLLNASAYSLSFPGICWTSTSICELQTRRQSFSKNNTNGIWVVKSAFEIDSAPALSERVGTRTGIRAPGNDWTAISTSAIWARASSAEILFWRSSWTGICNLSKSVDCS